MRHCEERSRGSGLGDVACLPEPAQAGNPLPMKCARCSHWIASRHFTSYASARNDGLINDGIV
jgi:hypothetical protein